MLHDYASLAQRSAGLAAGMQRVGLAPGDRVALFTSNDPAVLEILWGCWWAGLVVVPINPKLHPREASFIVSHSEAALLFVGADTKAGGVGVSPLPALRDTVAIDSAPYRSMVSTPLLPEPVPRDPNDLAWLFYTSGTTGLPKGVMLTHRNLLTMTLCYYADVDSVRSCDATLYAAPMSHGAGLYGLPHVSAGARHVVPESRGFDPAEILELARRHRELSMFAAPTMVRRLVEHAADVGSDGKGIKTIVYGGGPMYVEHIRHALKIMGPRFVQIYGQGESPMTITALAREHLAAVSHPRYQERISSVGVAQSAVELRVTDADGRELPLGDTGEVLVRGDTVMAGYWRDEVATAKTIREGWLFTGDRGSLDSDGFLTLRDRSKDLIISGGSNIYPREVEEVLLMNADVAEVSVVGREDPDWGEIVVAFVVARAGGALDTATLDLLCREHIARFKCPKQYCFVDALPKNHYGKVLKTELRSLLCRD